LQRGIQVKGGGSCVEKKHPTKNTIRLGKGEGLKFRKSKIGNRKGERHSVTTGKEGSGKGEKIRGSNKKDCAKVDQRVYARNGIQRREKVPEEGKGDTVEKTNGKKERDRRRVRGVRRVGGRLFRGARKTIPGERG